MQNSVGQQIPQQQVQMQPQYNNCTNPVVGSTNCCQSQPYIQQPQVSMNTQPSSIPGYSGVNIQIFNPAVTPNGYPVYNVNAPQYPQCYPSGYYTNQWGNNPNGLNGNNGNGINGNNPNGSGNNAVNGNNQNGTNNTNGSNQNDSNNSSINENNSTNSTNSNGKKTEKRDIVVLTDDYIKSLENYLNSQDSEIRYMGAKEVAARLEEDDSRKNDLALTALINKMLQDPSMKIRTLAIAELKSRNVTGDEKTKTILQNMVNSKDAYGQDALAANEILLEMSGQIATKEFEVKAKPETTKIKLKDDKSNKKE